MFIIPLVYMKAAAVNMHAHTHDIHARVCALVCEFTRAHACTHTYIVYMGPTKDTSTITPSTKDSEATSKSNGDTHTNTRTHMPRDTT